MAKRVPHHCLQTTINKGITQCARNQINVFEVRANKINIKAIEIAICDYGFGWEGLRWVPVNRESISATQCCVPQYKRNERRRSDCRRAEAIANG